MAGAPLTLIDEWQLFPATWDTVRRAVDADPTPGRFILTGSASLSGAPTHSGAARIVPVRMRPISLAECGIPTTVSPQTLLEGATPEIAGDTAAHLENYVDEILAGGLPTLRGLPERALRAQLDGYLQRVIDRELPEQGLLIRHPDTLRAWMRA